MQVTAACIRLSATRSLPRSRAGPTSLTGRIGTSCLSQSPVFDHHRFSGEHSSGDVAKTPPSTVHTQTRSSGLQSVSEETDDDAFNETSTAAEAKGKKGERQTNRTQEPGGVSDATSSRKMEEATRAPDSNGQVESLLGTDPQVNSEERGEESDRMTRLDEGLSNGQALPGTVDEFMAVRESYSKPQQFMTEPTELTESSLDKSDIGTPGESTSESTNTAIGTQKSTASTADSGFYTNQTSSVTRATIVSQFSSGATSEGSEIVCDEDLPSVVPPSLPEKERRHSTPGTMTSGITDGAEAQARPKLGASAVTEVETRGQVQLEAAPKTGKKRYTAPQAQLRSSGSLEEPRIRYNWSPRLGGGMSPGYDSLGTSLPGGYGDQDDPTFEIWTASSDAHHSVATVIEYNGKFTSVEVSVLHKLARSLFS